jgi:hypothetical protein
MAAAAMKLLDMPERLAALDRPEAPAAFGASISAHAEKAPSVDGAFAAGGFSPGSAETR